MASYWGNVLWHPPRPARGRDLCAAAARVLTAPAVAELIHTAHADVNGVYFVFAVPRFSESRVADEDAVRDHAEAAWRGVPRAELDAARDAERSARRAALATRHGS